MHIKIISRIFLFSFFVSINAMERLPAHSSPQQNIIYVMKKCGNGISVTRTVIAGGKIQESTYTREEKCVFIFNDTNRPIRVSKNKLKIFDLASVESKLKNISGKCGFFVDMQQQAKEILTFADDYNSSLTLEFSTLGTASIQSSEHQNIKVIMYDVD